MQNGPVFCKRLAYYFLNNALFTVALLFIFSYNLSAQEGSAQWQGALEGNEDDEVHLALFNDADIDGTTHTTETEPDGRIYFKLNEGDTAYLGMNCDENNNDFDFQVRGPVVGDPLLSTGSEPIVFGPQTAIGDGPQIPGAGTEGYIPDDGVTSTLGAMEVTGAGYDGIEIVSNAPADGVYYIEFDDLGQNIDRTYCLFDVSIADAGGVPQSGRLFSYRWSLYNNGQGGFDLTDLDFYAYQTRDSVTTFITLDDVVPGGFQLAVTLNGVTNTGDIEADRQSVPYSQVGSDEVLGEFPVFFTEPDVECFPPAIVEPMIDADLNRFCGNLDSCIPYTTNKAGLVTLFLDFDNDGVFTENSADVFLIQQNVDGPTEECIPWDGNDGFGNTVPDGTIVTLNTRIQLGVTHLPAGDFEINDNGFAGQVINPPFALGSLEFFWDDSVLNPNSSQFPQEVELNGCTNQMCHIWGQGLNTSSAGNSDGNQAWVNTWWSGFAQGDEVEFEFVAQCTSEIELTKTADDSNVSIPAQVGDVITYTFEVCNIGGLPVENVTVSDPLVTVTGTAIPMLAPGECDDMTFTGMYIVTQDDIDNCVVNNTATANAMDEMGMPVMAEDSSMVPLTKDPVIDIMKTGVFVDENGDGVAQVGETISYTFIVANTGNVTLTNVTVTDPLVTVVGGPIPSLPVGSIDNTTFTGTYVLTQDDIDAGSVANVATATGTDPNGDPVMDDDPEDVPVPQVPMIDIVKTGVFQDENGDGAAQIGETIAYTFVVENTGNVVLTNVTVTDPLVTVMGGPIPSLAAGAIDNTTFTGTYVLTQDDIDAGGVANVATATGTDPNGDPVMDDDPEDVPVPQEPMIDIAKTGVFQDENGDGVAQVGETIAYTFVVENTGNVVLTNVTVTDPLVTVIGGPISSLAVGAIDNTTFTGTYVLTQDDIDAGGVANVATATGTDPNGDPVMDDDPEDVPVPQEPMIDIVKTGVFQDENGDGTAQVGETIAYTFVVENTGNVVLTNVTVTDPLVTVVGGPIPSLAVGAVDNTTFTGTYVLTQADIDAGGVANVATATGTDPNGDPITDDDPEDVPTPQDPMIDIIKDGTFEDENGDGVAQVGETISYVFTVSNTGNVTLTNVTVTDPLVTVIGGPIPSLAAGAVDNTTFIGTYVLTQDDINAGSVANVATATGTDPNGDPVSDDDPEDVPTPQDPMIDLIKSGVFQDENGDGAAQVGETIAYTFVVENTGNVILTNVTVADPLVTVIGGPIPSLAVGAIDNTTFTGIYELTQDDIDAGGVANVATATGTDPNGDPVTDDDPEDVPTPQDPMIDIIKDGTFQDENGDNIAQVGETISYVFTVTNTGNVTLTNVTVTDPLVTVTGGPIPSLAVGESDNTTFIGTYVLTQADIDAGNVANVATTTGSDPNGDPVTDDDPEDVMPPQDPMIDLIKSGVFQDENGDGLAQAGETISYSFVVSNTGNVTLTGVTVTDPLVTVSGGPITLAPGEIDNTTFTGTYTLTQDDVDAAMVLNLATTTGTDPNGDPVNDNDPEETPFVQDPDITLVKEGTFQDENGDGAAQVGETISYMFTVINTGNVTLTNVMVTDPLVTVVGGPIPVLTVGSTDNTTFTGTYTLTQDDINTGNVLNLATTMATDPNGDPVVDDDPEDESIPQNPMIDIVKSGVFQDENGDGAAQVGETIAYTFVVTNTGNVVLTNVIVTDPLVTVIGSPIPSLAVGATDNTTFTGTYSLTQADIDAGNLANVATTMGTDPNGDPVVDDDPEDVPTPQEPMIDIIKDGTFQDENGDNIAQVGETISYVFTVTNTGNVTLTNVTVTDPLVTVTGGPIPSLAVGDSDNTTFVGTYVLTQVDIDAGNVANVATTTGTDPNGDPVTDDDPEDVMPPQVPMIDIIKSGVFQDENGDGLAQAGETISYNFVVTNTGNVTLTGVTVTDPLVTVTGGPITLTPGEIDNTSFTGTYTLTQDDVDAAIVLNLATTTGTDPNGDPVNDNDPEETPFVQDPDITLVKEGTFQDENGDGAAQVGETISYMFTVINTGNVTLTNVTVTDPLVTVIGGPIPVLTVGSTDNTTFTGTYTLTQDDINAGSVLNLATTMAIDPNGDPVVDDDPEDEPLPQIPMIDIVKSGVFQDENGDGAAQVGETIAYTFVVSNTGNVTLTNVTVTDPIVTVLGGPLPSLEVGGIDNATFTGVYTLTQDDIDAGNVANLATTTGSDPNGDPVTDDDPEDVPAPQDPLIDLIKDGTFQDENGDGAAQVGETISYIFTVTNTGNVTLTNVMVTDPLVTVLGGPIPVLPVGGIDNITFSGTYTLTQDDIDSGMVDNVATTTGSDPNGDPVVDDDPEQVPTPQIPMIDIVKSGAFQDENGDGLAQQGETISYIFVVTNTGNVTLTGVTVTDPLVTVSGGPIVLVPGEFDNTTFTGTYILTQDDVDASLVSNVATTTGNDPNGVPVMDNDPEETPFVQDPDITLLKAGVFQDENGDGVAEVGESIAYAFTVINTGNVTLTNVTVDDPLVTVMGGPIPILPVGTTDAITFTGIYILTQDDIDAGNVENVATTTGTDPNGDPVTDDDPEDILTPQDPAIDIIKSGLFQDENGDGVAQVGETISYIFTVSNTGNVTLTNVTVTDPIVTVIGGPIPSLAVGATDNTTFSGTYTLTLNDINNGTVANVATTSGDDPSGDPVSDNDPEDVPTPQDPMIDLVKTGVFQDENGDNVAQVGESISYTFIVTNTGNVTLTNVVITDPLVTIMGGPIPSLDPGQIDNTTFTGIYMLTQADIDAGSVPNVATTMGDDPNGNPVSDDDPEVTPTPQDPMIELLKSGSFNDENGDGLAQQGETISYVFIVMNTGNVTLTDVTVTDPLVTVIGGPIPSLAVGAIDNTSFTGIYTLTQADVDNGSVDNVATTSGNDPNGDPVMDTDPENTPFVQDPEIMLVKSGVFQDENGNGIAEVGESIAYQFTVTNTGNVTLNNVTVTDPLVTVVGGPIPILGVGMSDNITFTGTYILTQADIDAGNVINLATTGATDPDGNPVTDDDPHDNPAPQAPMIDLIKNSVLLDENGDGIAQVGETISYSFIVTNTGNVTLTNVVINDPLVTVVGGPIPSLEVGATDNSTFTGMYMLTQADIDAGSVDNVATTTGDDPDGNPVSDNDPENTPTPQAPAIDLIKTGSFQDENGDGVAQVGETISYMFTVTNTGNVSLVNVTIDDPIVTVTGGPIPILLVGDSDNTTFSGSYTLTQADINTGAVENLAVTQGTDPNGDPVSDSDPEVTPTPQDPLIDIIKSGVFIDENGDGIPQVGESLSYIFTVTNTGNVTLTNVIVTDPLVTVTGGPIPVLGVGMSDNTTFTGVYLLTQADIDNASVQNTATVIGTDPNGDPVTDDDPEDTPYTQDPEILLVKTGSFEDENGDGVAQVGETLTYTFSVTNTGNVTLTNVVVNDPLVTVIGGPIPILGVGETDNITFTGVYTLTLNDINAGAVPNTATTTGSDPNGDPVSDPDDEDILIPQSPSIDIIKTGTYQDDGAIPGVAEVGETIVYQFTVTNTGNVTLTNVTVTDPLVTVIGGPLPSLLPGVIDNTTFTGIYTLTQADIDAGGVPNVATVEGTDPNGEPPVTDNDPEDTPVPQAPMIDIIKNGSFVDENGDGVAQVGETISYGFIVTNTGNVTLTNVNVIDPIVTVQGGPIPVLLVGASDNTTFTGVYTLTQEDVDNGAVDNTAIVTGDDPNGTPVTDDDPETTPFEQQPGLVLEKIGVLVDENGDGIAQVGESISYVFTVSNTGSVTLTNIIVTDPLVTVIGVAIPVLVPGQVDNTTFSGQYILTQDDIDNGNVDNTATATGQDPDGNDVVDPSDEDIPLPQDPGISIIKNSAFNDENGDGIPQVGESILYTFVVANTGNVSLTNVIVTDPLVTVSGSAIPLLEVGETDSSTFTGSYILTQSDINNGNVENTALVSGDDPNGDPVTDDDIENTPLSPSPCISLIKTSELNTGPNGISDPGDIITFTYVATNCGNVTLTNVSLIEDANLFTGTGILPVPGPVVPSTLAPGQSGTATATYAITQADIEALGIDNQAIVTGQDPNGDDVTDLSDTGNPNDPNETGGPDDPTFTPISLPLANIFGQVTEDIDNNFAGEDPLANVLITLITSEGDTLQTFTDENGNYQFLNVVPGPFTLIETDPGEFFSVTDIDGGDPNVITGVLLPGEDRLDQDFVDAICDELVCNGDIQISLNAECELVLTPDQLLESPVPGDFDIMLFDEHGDFIRDDTLTAAEVGEVINFQISCLDNSCWGQIVVEANIIPQLESPCSCTEDGSIPAECTLWCGPNTSFPASLITPEEAASQFGICGPDLVGEIKVEEIRTGDICSPEGEVVMLMYTGKVSQHGIVQDIDILCQKFTTVKLDITEEIFEFPRDVVLDCDYLDNIELPAGSDISDFQFGSPESILASTGSGFLSYPTFVDMHDTILDVVTLFDTTLVEVGQTLREVPVIEIINGEEVWVVTTVVDKIFEEQITERLDTIGRTNPIVPIIDRVCNVLSGFSDVQFDACGEGIKIVRTWNLIDWCNTDVVLSSTQTIEIIDVSAPVIVESVNGELVPIVTISDLLAPIEPWRCSATVQLPQLNILDNCDASPEVVWFTNEGQIQGDFLVDLWLDQSPILVEGTVLDDCGNATSIDFNVIVIDNVPPVPVCETSLQVSLTSNGESEDRIAKIFGTDLDEGSHDSDCGKVTITVVRLEDWQDIVRDCQGNVVGFAPQTCDPTTQTTDLGAPIFKDDCEATGVNLAEITVAGEFVTFCCEDVGQIVDVILFLEDEFGNVNQCIVSIEVEDSTTPSIVCQDAVVSCVAGDFLATPAMLGAGCERENSFEVELLSESRGNNVCAGGQTVREWFIDLDISGDFTSGDAYCQQIVTVSADAVFDPNTIKWPRHYDNSQLEGVNIELNPEGEVVEMPQTITMGDEFTCVPDQTLEVPVWCDTECGLVGFSMESDTIAAGNACLKIIQRWTVVDWCTFDANGSNVDDENDTATDSFEAVEDWVQSEADAPGCPTFAPNIGDPVYFRYSSVQNDGYYTFDQILVVNDDTNPEINAPATYAVNTSGGATTKDDPTECTGSDVITVTASDFCGGEMTGASLLQWQITVSREGNIIASRTTVGAEASMNSQEGSPGDVHIITWRVRDGCGNEVSSETVVTFIDQQAPTPFCVSGLTTAFMASDGSVTVWAREFDFGSFDNCTDVDELRFTVVQRGADPAQPGDANFDDQIGVTFNCNEFSSFQELDVYVWDADNNSDFCTVGIVLADNGNNCSEETEGGSVARISGQVTTSYDLEIPDVLLTVEASNLPEYPKSTITGDQGRYQFVNNPLGSNYELSAEKDEDYLLGLSTLDLLQIQRHILAINPLDDPYKILAADASGDGFVTVADITRLRRIVLGIENGLTDVAPWLFVNASQDFFDDANPWPFIETIQVLDFEESMTNQDFIGVKIGDVNESYQGAETRQSGLISLQANNQEILEGETVRIPVNVSTANVLAGFQFTLNHSGLELLTIESAQLAIEEDNIGRFNEYSTISWNDAQTQQLDSENQLFTLVFKAKANAELVNTLALDGSKTSAEAYVGEELAIYGIELKLVDELSYTELMQNSPNPFISETTIGFVLPESTRAKLTIFDVSGKKIKVVEQVFSKGYQSVTLSRDDISASGIMYYQLETDDYSATKKMIVLE